MQSIFLCLSWAGLDSRNSKEGQFKTLKAVQQKAEEKKKKKMKNINPTYINIHFGKAKETYYLFKLLWNLSFLEGFYI